jgi:lysyl-tRNA synthetase, class II
MTETNTSLHGLSEFEARIKKVEQLRAQGIDPWPPAKEVTATCLQVHEDQKSLPQTDISVKEYVIAGRLMTIRTHGKTAFCHLQDATGRLQLYFKEDILGSEKFSFFQQYIDLGDYIWCKGTVFLTKTGELTLRVVDFSLLSKCLHPLPEKFHGLTDIETKYRQRYLDIMTNIEARDRFTKRSKIIQRIRDYLDGHGYLEVETPMLHPIPGGAAARPFITHHNALDTDFYLRIAPELYLKRLVVGGLERVYEINRNFRNEGISTRHNPEFTMLEFYTAHKEYHYIMDFIEHMMKSIVFEICGSLKVPFGDTIINFENFRRMSPVEALIEFGGIPKESLAPDRIDITCKEQGVTIAPNVSTQQKLFALFEACAESKLIDPVFIIDFPIEISPLAQRDPKDPRVAARFELFIAGMELGNGFNELNDPFDQAERFHKQAEEHKSGNEEAMHYDADYITALEYGMPPTVGVGIGIDRFVMLLTNTTSIKEVILFPSLKRKKEE